MSGFRYSNFIKFSGARLNETNKSINNTYKPGSSGVGATSLSNRRAKNRLATVVGPQDSRQFRIFNTLGLYNKQRNVNIIRKLLDPNILFPTPSVPEPKPEPKPN